MEKLAAKAETSRQLFELMLGDQSYNKAVQQLAGPSPFKQSSAYQVLQQARTTGQTVWHDQRHGHPSKFRPHLNSWLKQLCEHAPLIRSREIQQQLHQQFNLVLSTSQINRVRVQLGVANFQASRKLHGLNLVKPITHVGLLNVTTNQHIFTCVTHSYLLAG